MTEYYLGFRLYIASSVAEIGIVYDFFHGLSSDVNDGPKSNPRGKNLLGNILNARYAIHIALSTTWITSSH